MTILKFSCKIKELKKFMDMKLDYIDEVNMLYSNFHKILKTIKKLKKCKLIISGDFNQLDMINDVQKYDYKSTFIIKELWKKNNVAVPKGKRADAKPFNLIQLHNIPNLIQNNFHDKDEDVNIC